MYLKSVTTVEYYNQVFIIYYKCMYKKTNTKYKLKKLFKKNLINKVCSYIFHLKSKLVNQYIYMGNMFVK